MFQYARFRGWMCVFLIPVWFFCLIPSTQAAIGQAEQDQSLSRDIGLKDGESDTGLGRMVVSLFVVLAIIAAGVFLLKKLTPYRNFASNAKHSVQILSRVPLGQKTSICLVKIADEILVVGITSTNMSLLSKMNADDYYQKQDTEIHETSAEYKQSFRKILDKIGIKERRM